MTTSTRRSNTAHSLRAVEDAHDRALAVLADPDAPLLDAVVWLSAHLSAVHHAVHPELRRGLDRTSVDEVVKGAVRIERLLRELEQQLTGDALAAHTEQTQLVRSLANELSAHVDKEHRLLDQLGDLLSPEEQQRVTAGYLHALAHGPTRPHPHAPHGPALSGLAYRVNATRDRLMDTLDSRRVPTPRQSRAPVKPSRWGDYLLGASDTSSRSDRRGG